jgi:O-glycosyl hydrolase
MRSVDLPPSPRGGYFTIALACALGVAACTRSSSYAGTSPVATIDASADASELDAARFDASGTPDSSKPADAAADAHGQDAMVPVATPVVPYPNVTPEKSATLTIGSTDAQTMRGWGAFSYYHHSNFWSAGFDLEGRASVQRAVYQELGIDVLRVELAPDYYDAAQPDKLKRADTGRMIDGLVRHLRDARSLQTALRYFVSVWSPPAGLKEPPYEEGHVWIDRETKQRVAWKEGIEATADSVPTHLKGYKTSPPETAAEVEYVRYVVSALEYLKEQVGPALYISFQNEPTYAPSYDGCVYDAEQYARVAQTLRTRLDTSRTPETELMGGEGNIYWDTVDVLAQTPAALVPVVATHSYDCSSFGQDLLGQYWNPRTLREKYPNAQHWMSEWSLEKWNADALGAVTPMGYAIHSMRHFAREVGPLGFDAWVYWIAVTLGEPVHGTLVYSDRENLAAEAKKTPLFHALSRVFRNAPRGSSVRLVTSSDEALFTSVPSEKDGQADVVAFRHGDRYTLLLVNDSAEAVQVSIAGMPDLAAYVYQVTESEGAVRRPDAARSTGGLDVLSLGSSITIVTNGNR